MTTLLDTSIWDALEGLNRNGDPRLNEMLEGRQGCEELYRLLFRQSVVTSGRKFVERQTTRHAPDHPATFQEAEYLKATCLSIS